jgi:outer membrane lipoprotein SlyB
MPIACVQLTQALTNINLMVSTYTAVYCENTPSYTVPLYCAQDYEKIRSVYGAVLSKFTVKIRIAESIDLGIINGKNLYLNMMQSSTIIANGTLKCLVMKKSGFKKHIEPIIKGLEIKAATYNLFINM